MKIKDQITTPRIVAFILLSIIPLAALCLGILFIISNTIMDIPFIFSFIILPFACLTLLFISIFSNMRLLDKCLACFLLLLAFVVLFFFFGIWGKREMMDRYYGEAAELHYSETVEDFNVLPELDEIGNTQSLEFYDYFSSELGIFTCEGYTLICKYNDNEYSSEKAELENKYVFQEDDMSALDYKCSPEALLGEYRFRTLSISGEYNHVINFPKRLVFVGTNDITQEIIYISFYNDDIDYIEALPEFLLENCGWKYIRQEG